MRACNKFILLKESLFWHLFFFALCSFIHFYSIKLCVYVCGVCMESTISEVSKEMCARAHTLNGGTQTFYVYTVYTNKIIFQNIIFVARKAIITKSSILFKIFSFCWRLVPYIRLSYGNKKKTCKRCGVLTNQ